jgi:hypothetical protein
MVSQCKQLDLHTMTIETVADFIKALQKLDQDKPIMILDGFNGGGTPRSINFGPVYRHVTDEDADECADCEAVADSTVYVIGYGSY